MKFKLFSSLLFSIGMSCCCFAVETNHYISGGVNSSVYTCDEGVYAWGQNYEDSVLNNILTLDTTVSDYVYSKFYNSPQKVDTKGIRFKCVDSSGDGSFIGISDKGIAYVWGCSKTTTSVIGTTPVPCGDALGYNEDGSLGGPYLGNVKAVAGNSFQFIALLNDGTAVIFGSSGYSFKIPSQTPSFVKTQNDSILRNINAIAAGGQSFMMMTNEGLAYSMGIWNGRGADGLSSDTFAAPVLLESTKEPITRVTAIGYSSVAGYVVVEDGNVYGWGNGGWGCSNGLLYNTTNYYAGKVISGQYEQISGDVYLTNVKAIDGGNGYGMALTYDGYVLYFGNNDNGTGGVIGNEYAGSSTCATGPQFLIYEDSTVVNDAVAISCGSTFGFIINSKNEYYAFGLNNKGQCGIGSNESLVHRLKKIDLPCEPKSFCPSVDFKQDTVVICPDDSIHSTIVATENSPYSVTWSYNDADAGLNEVCRNYGEGLYKVTLNCEKIKGCPNVSDSLYVKLIDSDIKSVNAKAFVSSLDNLSASDSIVFDFKANAADIVVVYADEDESMPLDSVFNDGSVMSVSVPADKVTFSSVRDSSVEANVWAKGLQYTTLHSNVIKEKEKSSYLPNCILTSREDVTLKSFKIKLINKFSKSTLKPCLMSTVLGPKNTYIQIDTLEFGKMQTLDISDDTSTVTIYCDFKLEAGKVYALGVASSGYPDFFVDNLSSYTSSSSDYIMLDDKNLGVELVNMTSFSSKSDLVPFFNLFFEKEIGKSCGLNKVNTIVVEKSTQAGVDILTSDPESVDVYSTLGILLKRQVKFENALNGLPIGVYIVNGKKVVKTTCDK